MSSTRITKHLDRLILDPNNYRFIDKTDYREVAEKDLADIRIQQRTLNFILGKNNSNVEDLISSFQTNGFLDIDQIQVKAVGDKYLVIEGNRRIATLKFLFNEYKEGNDVGKLVEADFISVNLVEIIEDDPVLHLVSMGLHHISGKKRWNAVNEAQLISDLIDKHGKTEKYICDALGISTIKLRRSIRTLRLIEIYKRSDYGDQFKSSMYSIFESVISSNEMRTWLQWDNTSYVAYNTSNLERLFTWLSRTEEIAEVYEEIGDEEKVRTVKLDPIITQYRQIKELSQFINDNQAVKKMEDSRSIVEGYSYSNAIGVNKLKNAMANIKSEVQAAFNFSDYLTRDDYEEIERLKLKLDRLIPSSEAHITINHKSKRSYFSTIGEHFSEITISNYRKLNNVKIKKLSLVNIFAGGNNIGKTSLLEAVYLMCKQNNLNGFLELENYRGKFVNSINSVWVDSNFISPVDIASVFNNTPATLRIFKDSTNDDIDKSGYLNTIIAESIIDEKSSDSSVHLFSNKEASMYFTEATTLCSATFTSPFIYSYSLLERAYSSALEEKYLEEVVAFIREHLDSNIEKIEMTKIEGEGRFVVTSSILNKAIDITRYGEGLQRIFEIALLIAYSRDGIICIDEVDSAIHKELLIEFTKFIQKAAEKYNVQVFLTTHSKECIDAFANNNYRNDQLTAFVLTDDGGGIKCKYIEGSRLKQLIESINFDIR